MNALRRSQLQMQNKLCFNQPAVQRQSIDIPTFISQNAQQSNDWFISVAPHLYPYKHDIFKYCICVIQSDQFVSELKTLKFVSKLTMLDCLFNLFFSAHELPQYFFHNFSELMKRVQTNNPEISIEFASTILSYIKNSINIDKDYIDKTESGFKFDVNCVSDFIIIFTYCKLTLSAPIMYQFMGLCVQLVQIARSLEICQLILDVLHPVVVKMATNVSQQVFHDFGMKYFKILNYIANRLFVVDKVAEIASFAAKPGREVLRNVVQVNFDEFPGDFTAELKEKLESAGLFKEKK
ncbi:Hypothetical_protein [Hexamita inflata]|uniref:Hypothetical_protein n=1 Tax=Hexamita inflata TaxID=28002 RepID=A0AA86UWS0_9EUKA|nr:Hypothetical protein HINF_LOCUS58739 [Hexamita inflata]